MTRGLNRLKDVSVLLINLLIKLVPINAYVKLVSKLIQPIQWLALILMNAQVKMSKYI